MLKKTLFVLAVAILAMFGLGVRCGAEVEETRAPDAPEAVAVK